MGEKAAKQIKVSASGKQKDKGNPQFLTYLRCCPKNIVPLPYVSHERALQ